jgi:hypothetical protein
MAPEDRNEPHFEGRLDSNSDCTTLITILLKSHRMARSWFGSIVVYEDEAALGHSR